MKRNLLLLILLFWGAIPFVHGQAREVAWQQIFHVKTDQISLLDINNKGNIFCADPEGNLIQYNESGEPVNHYSPTIQGELNQLQMMRTVNLFTFSQILQRFEILDRFLNPVFSGNIDHAEIGLIRAAALGNNHILWIFDETDFALKQYDYRRNRVLQQQPLQLFLDGPQLSIQEILEYQNLLFVRVESKGVYIFDNQGNLIHSLTIPSVQKLVPFKQQLFLVENNHLLAINFFSGQKSYFTLPDPSYEKVALDKNRVIFYGEDFITAYTAPSGLFD